MWLALSLRHGSIPLPTCANPTMEVGGLWGERKSQGLSLFGKVATGLVPAFLILTRGDDPTARADMAHLDPALAEKGMTYPLMIKPDRGYQGWGVRQVQSSNELAEYLNGVTPGATLVLPTLIPFKGEAGIFYVRDPGAAKGQIVSMALTYAPFVLGNGHSPVRDLIRADPVLRHSYAAFRERLRERFDSVPDPSEVVVLTNTRSARLGAVYLDVTHMVTPKLSAVVEKVAKDVEGFHFGRFDMRFRSFDDMLRGEAM